MSVRITASDAHDAAVLARELKEANGSSVGIATDTSAGALTFIVSDALASAVTGVRASSTIEPESDEVSDDGPAVDVDDVVEEKPPSRKKRSKKST